jgi:DNA-binding NarL/FixJ family response regulator
MSPIRSRIVLVDDHQIIREGLRLMLQREPDFEVVAEAGTGAEALQQVRKVSPDLVVMDLELGNTNGIETSRKILMEFPGVRILILSALADQNLINQAIETGAKGYLLKTKAANEFVRAIRAIMAGDSYLCAEVSQAVLSGYRQLLAERSAPAVPTLSPRELEVLKLTAQGLRIKDIAGQLEIGAKTVETHRSNLMKKLKCGSSAELTRYAVREGISPL